MKNKNQKEIDDIVGIIEKIIDIRKLADIYWREIEHPQNLIIDEEEVIRVLSLKFEKIAKAILTKLKENEIMLAKGKVKIYETYPAIMGDKSIGWSSLQIELEKFKGKNIILIARVEDENK